MIMMRLLIATSAMAFTVSCLPTQNASESKTIVVPYADDSYEEVQKQQLKKQKLEKQLLLKAISQDERVKALYLKITTNIITKNVSIGAPSVERTCMMEQKFNEKGPTVYTYTFSQDPQGGTYTVSVPSQNANGLSLHGDEEQYQVHELIILFEKDPIDLENNKINEFKVKKVMSRTAAPAPC
jgi:hypothetical protein